MVLGWILATLVALGAAPLHWFYDDPLQLCRYQGHIDTLDELALCMQRFVVPESAIPPSLWREETGFIPSLQQRHDLDKFVRNMASASSAAACKKLLLPASLKRVYRPPRVFRDAELHESVCLLLERTRGGRFVAGWAWLAVRPKPAQVEQLVKEGRELMPIGTTAAARTAEAIATAVPNAMDGTQPPEKKIQRPQKQRWSWAKASVWFRSSWVTALWGVEGAGVGVRLGMQPEEDEAPGDGGFHSGWSPGARQPLRRVHLGAPHPEFEGIVDLQAVALFRRVPSLARSVVVSGKHRRATSTDSTCLPGLGYPASDPSHNDGDAFNVISFALLRMEKEELDADCAAGGRTNGSSHTADNDDGGGSGSSRGGGDDAGDGGGSGRTWGRAMFLQLHGKREESCPSSTLFASGGFGSNATAFYGRKDTAVAALVAALEEVAAAVAAVSPPSPLGGSSIGGGWTVSMPPDDPVCALAATRNVLGRVINGVPRRDACSRPGDEGSGGGRSCFGSFAHVEQAEAARAPGAWGLWVEVLRMLQSRDSRDL